MYFGLQIFAYAFRLYDLQPCVDRLASGHSGASILSAVHRCRKLRSRSHFSETTSNVLALQNRGVRRPEGAKLFTVVLLDRKLPWLVSPRVVLSQSNSSCREPEPVKQCCVGLWC